MKTRYWIMKSEPDCYSIDDLKKSKTGMWDGVRNYQVRNAMRDEMQVGDKALFYHSSAGKATGVAGVMTITKSAYPDPTQFDPKDDHYDAKSIKENPRWLAVDVAFEKKFDAAVLLSELRMDNRFAGMKLLEQGSRLSIVPLTKKQFDLIVKLGT